jgi:glycine oxidase ThiO
VKSWDVIIVGAGIIGLSLSFELRKRGASVLIVERGEPARESSHAAAGMLVGASAETLPPLRSLAAASAAMYPEFVHELQDESGLKCDLRQHGTIHVADNIEDMGDAEPLDHAALLELEPALKINRPAFLIKESSVDPRALCAAALKAAFHRGVTVTSGNEVQELLVSDGRVSGVRTQSTTYASHTVVNCAGCWAAQLPPFKIPTRPIKGQMLSLVGHSKDLLRHAVRASQIYLVPRSDGRMLAGATVEDVGYDKHTVPETIQHMHRAAIDLVPALSHSRILEDWAGLRPGTPDRLPILGPTSIPGYFAATGHLRDGILLAPISAKIMAAVISGQAPEYDISAFSPMRFQL